MSSTKKHPHHINGFIRNNKQNRESYPSEDLDHPAVYQDTGQKFWSLLVLSVSPTIKLPFTRRFTWQKNQQPPICFSTTLLNKEKNNQKPLLFPHRSYRTINIIKTVSLFLKGIGLCSLRIVTRATAHVDNSLSWSTSNRNAYSPSTPPPSTSHSTHQRWLSTTSGPLSATMRIQNALVTMGSTAHITR